MKIIFVVISIISFAYAATTSNRIISGEIAKKGQFPHEVSLRYFARHLCGGAILNEEWILTAAHCVAGLDDFYLAIIAGTTIPDNDLSEGGIHRYVEYTTHHPNYTTDTITASYDIALLKLHQKLLFDELVQPIPLVSSPVPSGAGLTLSGWGVTHPDSQVPSVELRYLKVNAIDLGECGQRFQELGYPVDETMLCGEQGNGKGACMGDSGSPLVFDGRAAGVASWVEPCGIGYPDVYANVFMFVDWIEEQMRKK